jgi:PAS domain S-box-containing protein
MKPEPDNESPKPSSFGPERVEGAFIPGQEPRSKGREALSGSPETLSTVLEIEAAVLDAIPASIVLIDRKGYIVAENENWRRFARSNGMRSDGFIGQNYISVCETSAGAGSEDARRVADGIQEVISGKRDGFSLEYPCHSPEEQRWFRVTVAPIRTRNRTGAMVMHFDISGRKLSELELASTNRAFQLLTRCNEAMIRSESEVELARAVCRIAVEDHGFPMAWVGYARNNRQKSIDAIAVVGAEEDYLSKVQISWDESVPNGQGPAGRLIRSGKLELVPDLGADESFLPWLESARSYGFQGVLCLPLSHQDRTFGIFVLYLSAPNSVHSGELELLENLAADMAFGIMSIRARTDRQKTHDAVLRMARGVSASRGDEFFEQLAFSMVEALGADGGIIARLSDDLNSATSVSMVFNGQSAPNITYPVAGLPCEDLVNKDIFSVDGDLQDRYPGLCRWPLVGIRAYVGVRLVDSAGSAIGLMFVVFKQPQEHNEFIASTLKIFAARAADELERRTANSLLREQAALLDMARDAILVCDLDNRIVYWNRSAERIYGWSAEEVTDRFAEDLLYRDPGPLHAAVKATIETGEWMGEIAQFTKSGRELIVEGRWSLVRDELGEPKSILSINTDITERKNLERQFLRSQRVESIGTLAGGVAHDLNNVLAPIIMSIDLLRMYVEDPEGLEILDTVEKSARRGSDMVSQVLSFARGVEGEAVDVNVVHVFQDLMRIIEEAFPKNIRVTGQFDKDLWLVKADPTQIHQVLLNLCVNSRDAMPEGGHIDIKIENVILDEHYSGTIVEATAGPYLKIDVEDNGHGIPTDIIDKIFDPFFTTKDVGNGTGLGLSTSVAIIKRHGGFIRVYSDPGIGTSFRIYLPAVTGSGLDPSGRPSANLLRGHGETVLVVDDEASIRFITKKTLEAFGYRVLLASDGSEAVSIFVSHQDEIAVVITDMMMPIMDGPATIKALRRLRPDLPIIGASGIAATGNVAKALNAGVKEFLPKPYTADSLLEAVHKVLVHKG